MNHNPFIPREQRTAILTFDNGQRIRAEVLIPKSDRPMWHDDLERRFIRDLQVAATGSTQARQSAYPAQLISEHIKTVKNNRTMKEEYTSWEYFKEDTPITNIKVNPRIIYKD